MAKYTFLVLVAVLFVFAKQSHGNALASLNKSAQIEKIIADPKFQDAQEAIIRKSKDKESLVARAAIDKIRMDLQNYIASAPSPLAANAAIQAIEGVLDAVRLINGIVHAADKSLDIAMDLVKNGKIEEAAAAAKNGMTHDRELVFAAGVPIHNAQGSALALAGGEALEGLKETIISIQLAGSTAFEALKIAGELTEAGIKEGGPAAEAAFKSAQSILSTGSKAIYYHLEKAARNVLGGLANASSKTTSGIDVVPGVIESLKPQITTKNSAALKAIAKLSNGLNSALSVLTKKSAIYAAQIISEGLSATIQEAAFAISFAKNSLEEARQLAKQDRGEAAEAKVRQGINTSEFILLRGSAPGYLALGAAGEIAGKLATEQLVKSVIDVEYGRVDAYDDMKLAERTAIMAIRGGEESLEEGIDAAIQMCDASGLALFQDYTDAGEMGFKVLQQI